jgi:cytochrome d ubiquinol oxidase subunit I
MSVEMLARIQFAFTIMFHYIYPPISIGLGLMLVFMEGAYLKTKNPVFQRLTHFWVKIFALVFAIGVATGIVMEFEFGTNWATYSRYVGDIFGSALAAEGVFAFFLESGFLAILVFGWDRVSPKIHFLSTIMVALGSTFSAVWIIVANSWMQTPAGYKIVTQNGVTKARITDFWAMVFNPSTMDRLSHTVSAAWLTGSFFVISVAAYYLVKGRFTDIAKASMKIGLTVALAGSMLQFLTGHMSAVGVAANQPEKMAAMEGHASSSKPLDLTVLGWADPKTGESYGLKIHGMDSFLLSGSISTPVRGMDSVPKNDRPPIQLTFQAFHLMIAIGTSLFGLSLVSVYLWWRGALWDKKWFLKILIWAVALPQIGNQAGWMTAEVGRQPWIVYHMLRTDQGLSKVVTANQIVASLVIFTLVYALLFALFIYLLNKAIDAGPEEPSNPIDNPVLDRRDTAQMQGFSS